MKNMDYADKSLKYYLACLAEKTTVPGGGSACALVGSLGCGLLSMVANFTLSDKGFNGYKERSKKVLKVSEYLRKKFMLIIDEDAKAYKRLSIAFKKNAKNSPAFQKALKSAIVSPSRVCDYSYKAAIAALELSYIGKKAILSDVISAIHNLDAAFESGLVNIYVNIRYVKNKTYASNKADKYKSLQRDMKQIKNKVLSITQERMNV
jgi:methenyltetrahydrofolate cyclohydrolase